MAVPKKKTSKSVRNMRRAHDALDKNHYLTDAKTGNVRRPHHVDLKSGEYRGRKVLDVETSSTE